LDFSRWRDRRENMQPSTPSTGTPTPEKSTQPPSGEVGEGDIEIENLARMLAGDIREAILKHLFGKDCVDIEPSEGYEWNGWIIRDWDGKYFRDFRTGSYWEYVSFSIRLLRALIRELQERLAWFEAKEKELDELWEKVMKK
jgi:hypothetical protein